MKKKRTSAILLVFAVLFLLSSCASAMPETHAGTLDKELSSPPTVGLLNPDAEVRGVWIATVGNINYPSKKGLGASALASELDAIVETCVRLGLNTIFFQVRPAADALYRSELFPQSEFVSGTQGKAPDGNFDSLEYLINAAHEYKINVHAWVNPLRVTYGSAKYPKTDVSALADSHIARKHPDWTVAYADGKLYFDAGNPDVREYIAKGAAEIVTNYAVDGVVFDDYFYPYPVKTEDGVYAEFDDASSYEKYGTGSDKGDWRRENINLLVEGCHKAVKEINSECAFGIAPFGIWQNDDGTNGGSATRGLEAYSALYCDATAWVKGGYVDYIAPQLYWRFDTAVAPYGELVDWWNGVLDGTGVKLLVCHAAYMYEDGWENPSGEIAKQIEYARDALCYRGSLLYGYKTLESDAENIDNEIKKTFEHEIIYSDTVSNFRNLTVSLPSETASSAITVTGESDPTKPLYFGRECVNRTKNGDFEFTVALSDGENVLSFTYDGREYIYKVTKNSNG